MNPQYFSKKKEIMDLVFIFLRALSTQCLRRHSLAVTLTLICQFQCSFFFVRYQYSYGPVTVVGWVRILISRKIHHFYIKSPLSFIFKKTKLKLSYFVSRIGGFNSITRVTPRTRRNKDCLLVKKIYIYLNISYN